MIHFFETALLPLLWLCAVGYGICAIYVFRKLQRGLVIARLSVLEQTALLVLLSIHAVGLMGAIAGPAGLRFGWASAVSGLLWAGLAFLALQSSQLPVGLMRVLLLPAAAVFTPLLAIYPGAHYGQATNTLFIVHLGCAMLAYSVLALAACHALVMALTDRFLRHSLGMPHDFSKPPPDSGARLWRQALIDSMPPLLTLERLLFRLTAFGFVLLSLTVLTGSIFSHTTLGVFFKLDHKTVLTLMAWAVFGLLLLGRALWGWRGQMAVRMSILGFAMLLLGYVGSRFVLQIILQRPAF